jgi:hypothetical protein
MDFPGHREFCSNVLPFCMNCLGHQLIWLAMCTR